jgi:hypothetical protein
MLLLNEALVDKLLQHKFGNNHRIMLILLTKAGFFAAKLILAVL